MNKSLLLCAALATSSLALLDAGRAEACGGCFVPQVERTVVTDHRMALSVSPDQTVLWDQIRYAGDPAEFAWVLPVRAGAKIEVSNDAWFAALDASTQPAVYQPSYYGGAYGCALTGCASEESASGFSDGAGSVQVISQSVVGPYETVTLRSTDPDALTTWLRSHSFDIPSSIQPTIDAYTHEGFDFIALRLRPTCGERSMQPVRVTWPGADPTLPLRMVAAGVGANVGITLYVISEGRWHPQNFPDALIDDDALRWDRVQNKSNYEELSRELMAQNDGRTWLVEYADRPSLYSASRAGYAQQPAAPYYGGRGAANPGLADAYFGLCRTSSSSGSFGGSSGGSSGSGGFTPCPNGADAGVSTTPPSTLDDGGSDAGDADGGGGVGDAGDLDAGDDAGDLDGGTGGDGGSASDDDAGTSSDAGSSSGGDGTGTGTGTYPPSDDACAYLDDLDVALHGLHASDVWVTRLRAVLPANALSAGDLRLEPAKEQTAVSNVHYAAYYADEDRSSSSTRSSCNGAPKRHTVFGSWALAASAALGAVAFLRRRRR
jgi:hypothetical protein